MSRQCQALMEAGYFVETKCGMPTEAGSEYCSSHSNLGAKTPEITDAVSAFLPESLLESTECRHFYVRGQFRGTYCSKPVARLGYCALHQLHGQRILSQERVCQKTNGVTLCGEPVVKGDFCDKHLPKGFRCSFQTIKGKCGLPCIDGNICPAHRIDCSSPICFPASTPITKDPKLKRKGVSSTSSSLLPPPSPIPAPQPPENSVPEVPWELNKLKLCTRCPAGGIVGEHFCGKPASFLALLNCGDFYLCNKCAKHIDTGSLLPLGVRRSIVSPQFKLLPFDPHNFLYQTEAEGFIVFMRNDPVVIGKVDEEASIVPLTQAERDVACVQGFRVLTDTVKQSLVQHKAASLEIREFDAAADQFVLLQSGLIIEHSEPGILKVLGKANHAEECEPLNSHDLRFAYQHGLIIMPPQPSTQASTQEAETAKPSSGITIHPGLEMSYVPIELSAVTNVRFYRELDRDIILRSTKRPGQWAAVGKTTVSGIIPITDQDDLDWLKARRISYSRSPVPDLL
jgi:hypothetical protein